MKKITFILILFTIGLQAQQFPDPYCDITDPEVSVEEITVVEFAGITMTNNDMSSVLVDNTSTIIEVEPNETYTLEVQGNTYGDFDNDIVAFIDWDQNGVLDDTNEVYEIGTLTNSAGSDGVSVSMQITVPADVMEGETRVRITKIYGDEESPAIINPCAIEMDAFGQGAFPGFGQALDFTLNVETLSTKQFESSSLAVYPIPAQEFLNINYKEEIQLVIVYNLLGKQVYSENAAAKDIQLDISTLSPGFYMVKLFAGNGQHSLKIIKE